MFDREAQEIMQLGKDADSLLNNPAFTEAVQMVFNQYCLQEERLVYNAKDVDTEEATRQVLRAAMMRRTLQDVVDALNILISNAATVAEDQN